MPMLKVSQFKLGPFRFLLRVVIQIQNKFENLSCLMYLGEGLYFAHIENDFYPYSKMLYECKGNRIKTQLSECKIYNEV